MDYRQRATIVFYRRVALVCCGARRVWTGDDDDPSMDKVFQELVRNGKVAAGDIAPQEKNQVLLAMFAVLC